ncbi:MAG TPA: CBS domain-containing protein, partial [Gemmatimonadetes bacterium]|nr:CBS domain-containing protein [Gemmatimonadota bacterium]
ILSPSTKTVGEIMDANPISVTVTDDQETVVHKLRHYDFLAIPVLDDRGIMVGIVTHDDVLDVAFDEAF